jgi:hypothetical protein
MDTKEGGLFQLDVKRSGKKLTVKATKIVSLDKPSAMAFNDEGALFVTIFGTAEEGSDKKPGQVVEVQAKL